MTNGTQLELNGKSIFFKEEPGTKGTIIAIHGLTGSHKNMVHYARHLKGDYRVISVDLRGRGNSSELAKMPTLFEHANDILQLIEKLEIEEPILLGHSMGAFISSIVASKLPSTKAVILLDGAASMSEHQDAIVQPSLGRLSKEYTSEEHYVEEIKTIYAKLGVTWSDDVQDCVEYEVGNAGDHWENRSDEAGIRADWKSFYEYNPNDICSKIQCPVLLVYAKGANGALPPLFRLGDYDTTLAVTPNIKLYESDCNHYTMVFEKRPDILSAIDAFLANVH